MKKGNKIEVPRDPRGETPTAPTPSGESPSPATDAAQVNPPLSANSAAAIRLHENPPKGDDQLRTGSGGDAARPGKEGIYGKPIPPVGRP